ncbi:MAG: thioredoxin family protein [Epsilonproteobacteria bacterium]|nr:thioredoxin family protein [Campylobacterota bacterium]
MKFLFLVATLILSLADAQEGMLKESRYEFVRSSIGKGKPYFLEVGAESCRTCKSMSKMLYQMTQKYPNYNIHFINVAFDRETAYALNVRMIPTQIIYDKAGKEVFRNIGALSQERVESLFEEFGFKEE